MGQTTSRSMVAVLAGTTTAQAAKSMGGGVFPAIAPQLAVLSSVAGVMTWLAARNERRQLPGI